MSKPTKKDLETIFNSLPEDGKKFMQELSDEERTARLTTLFSLSRAGEAAAKQAGDVETISLEDDSANDTNLIFGKEIFPGMTLDLDFMGAVHLMSKQFKENWAETVIDGEMYYESRKWRFRNRETGEIVHLFNTPMLGNVLRCIPTHSSPLTRGRVHKDPRVLITYHGKVGREEAKEKYGFEFNTGKEAHAVTVKILDTDFPVDRFQRGIINWVEEPYRVNQSGEEDAVSFEKSRWESATRTQTTQNETTQENVVH